MTASTSSAQETALSSRPDLDQIKRQAKELLKAQKAGDPSVCDKLRKVQRFANMSNDEILTAKIKLAEAQHAVAKDYGFNTWADLKQQVLKAGEKNILHIHCGDHSADSLRQSSIGGEVLVWHDPVHEGPVPGNVSDQEYREARAKFFVGQQYTKTYEGALQGLTARHEKLAQSKDYAEIVLWFDACLFDQTIMIHLIEELTRIDTGKARLSLICVGDHPEFKRFVGLGELNSEQMGALFPNRHEITAAEKELAVNAWKAFASNDPRAIADLLAQDCSALPYLADALRRHLEQYPSVINGLNRLQREALEVVAAGTNKLGQIFREVSNKEERPFFGDTTLWNCMDELAGGPAPLLKIDGPGPLKHSLWDPIQKIGRWSVAVTSSGQDVLSAQADFIKLNGIDRWLGGVHLQGAEARWRWDSERGRLIGFEVKRPRQPDVIARQLHDLPICEANARDVEKDKTGGCSALLSGEYRWHAVHEYDENKNSEGFRRYLCLSANLAATLLRRLLAGEPISSGKFTVRDAYMSILDAWAALDFGLARQIAGLIEELPEDHQETEGTFGYVMDPALGQTLTCLALGRLLEAEKWNSKFLDLCRKGTYRHERGYPMLISAFLSHKSDLIPEALAAIIEGHDASQETVGHRTEFALLCLWGLGVVNFGIQMGYNIDLDDPMIPKDLQMRSEDGSSRNETSSRTTD